MPRFPPPRFPRSAWTWACLALLALISAAGVLRARRGVLRPERMVVAAEAEGWEGCSPAQRQGLLTLLRDAFETEGGIPVSDAAEFPAGPPPDAARLHVRARRTAERLEVDLRYQAPGGKERRWTEAGGDPGALLPRLLRPFGLDGGPRSPFLSDACRDLGELLEAAGWTQDRELDRLQTQTLALARRIPHSPSAWLALAMVDHRRLVLASTADPVAQSECRAHFDRALAALPAYPRAVHQLAVFLTDLGDQREALALLEGAVAAHPRVIRLRTAQGYAARTAGLLEGALRALRVRDRLQGAPRPGVELAENLYLYLGDWDRFEAILARGPAPGSDALTDFYRGYIRLLRGDRPAALEAFRRAQAQPGKKIVFERLSAVFQAALEGDRTRALALLDPLRDQRLRLRVPDGEFTFKLAEAYALLGEEAQAILVAERAFAQGFGCLRWYETAPLLADVRRHPRWPSLHQHLQDRQALLDSRFPARRFGNS